MKKLKIMLTVLCVCISCLLLLTACSEKLSAPTSFRLDTDTLTLHWNKVKQAAAYTVEIGENISVTTRETSFPLEDLEPGEYVVRVRAITYGDQFEESDFAEFKFTREKETGLKYKLNSTRDAYELVGIGDASGDIVMEDYFRGKPVTSIAKGALRRCGRITSFVVGKNVKTIGENAFASCAEMTSITIPEGVTSIGKAAFQSCAKLQSITLPNTLESISPYCFSMCKGLETVVVGDNVKYIDEYAFADCILLKKIEISDGVETLSEYAFSGCVALSDVQFGSNLKNIERFAFYGCSALRTVSLNNQLQNIAEGAFQTSGLTSLTLPDSVIFVGPGSFANCAALEEVTLGSGLQTICQNAFTDTPLVNNYEGDVVVVGDWILKANNMEMEEYTFPENVIGIADGAFMDCKLLERINLEYVKYIGTAAFMNCERLWEVITGDATVVVGDYAFANCVVLWQVTLGNSVETIGSYAFASCEDLEDTGIDIPKSVMTIGTGAFENTLMFTNAQTLLYVDDWLVDAKNDIMMMSVFIKEGTRGIANYACTDIHIFDGQLFIADSVERIGRGAFYKNQEIRNCNLPANLKYIGEYAFTGCEGLIFTEDHTLRIPDGCEYIGDHAFRDCKSVINLFIPGTVKYVGNRAFKGCINLGFSQFKVNAEPNAPNVIGDVLIGNGVEYMGEQVFYGCIGLQTIKLPDTLKTLGTRAFYKCEMLENLELGTGLAEIPAYTFYDCTMLRELVVPGNVKNIGKYAFRGCTGLEKLTLAQGVESVEKYAFFKNTNIRSLSIADSVTYIGDYAFRNMEKLRAIYLHDQFTYIGKLAFHGAKNATIYMEGNQVPETWAKRWNGSFMPIVMGAELSDDNSYVVSWSSAGGKLENVSTFVSLVDPSRSGYTFVGWSTVENDTTSQYADLSEVPADTTVYSVWTEGETEEIPEGSTGTEDEVAPTQPNTLEGN